MSETENRIRVDSTRGKEYKIVNHSRSKTVIVDKTAEFQASRIGRSCVTPNCSYNFSTEESEGVVATAAA